MLALAVFYAWVLAESAAAAPPQITGTEVSAVSLSSAILEADINPQGKETAYRFEYGTVDCSVNFCTPVAEGSTPVASVPAHYEALVEGLNPGLIYHFRIVATNGDGKTSSPDRVFATYSGPFLGLPDDRAYEQASPVDKGGNDIVGDAPIVKAAASGGGITFASTFGIPGGKGAQDFPSYLASRGAGWVSQGLLPPPEAGERAQVIGWTPDYTETFVSATQLNSQRETAFIAQSTADGSATTIVPFTANADFAYAGASQDSSTILFESRSKLVPSAREDLPNLYAWDRASGKIRLAGVFNDETSPPKGAFAGPYEWTEGISAQSLRLGGAARGFYLQDEHAVTPSGDIYFTAAGTGQLYLRQNPTEEQSPTDGEGKCINLGQACTLHVSASQKDNGQGPNGADAAGPQPAAFQAASVDGSKVFFTSPEKLTNDANTGPEQPAAAIGVGNRTSGTIESPSFVPSRAVGVAVHGSYIYWADPVGGAIGRANADGSPASVEPDFIVPGPIECEVEGEPGVFEEVPSKPRYVAVDAGHVYWTNTGCLEAVTETPLDHGGTIGRADAAGTEGSIEPAFITGASNPQGIAVNATHVYWANAGRETINRSIGRAETDGGGVEAGFFEVGQPLPYGLALSSTHVYVSLNDKGNDLGYIGRVPLSGGEFPILFIGKSGIRGVAADADHVYWATQGEEAIGRADLELTLASRTKEFVKPAGKLNGLAADATRLYWSVNGESPSNPGNDLYRFEVASGTLEDLTPDSSDENGAEVQGLVGASADGSRLYFAANGDLDEDGPATAGNCHGAVGSLTGSCSLYLWQEGMISLVARLRGSGSATGSDALNWAATPRGQFGTSSYVPKTAFTSIDGKTLLFRSQEKLTAYDNEGVPELYRFEVGEGIACASCRPSGEAADEGPKMGRALFPGIGPLASVAAVSSRNLSASGNQVFFETSEALSPLDTNGDAGCPISGTSSQFFPACNDIYEWEAPGAGNCKEGGPSFSPLNGGCVYLISTGKDKFPSLFADASASGNDVFFFTRQRLVGQDKDELQDVYDARVGGGLASQSPPPFLPCPSVETCRGPVQSPPSESMPGSATFAGPGNEVPKHKQKGKRRKAKKPTHKQKGKKARNRQQRAMQNAPSRRSDS